MQQFSLLRPQFLRGENKTKCEIIAWTAVHINFKIRDYDISLWSSVRFLWTFVWYNTVYIFCIFLCSWLWIPYSSLRSKTCMFVKLWSFRGQRTCAPKLPLFLVYSKFQNVWKYWHRSNINMPIIRDDFASIIWILFSLCVTL